MYNGINSEGCFEVELMYEVDSIKNRTLTEISTAKVILDNWNIVELILSGSVQEEMTLQKALFLAQNSECILYGDLTSNYVYNNITKAWWVELDIPKSACKPACVISEVTKSAEVNWRCNGVLG